MSPPDKGQDYAGSSAANGSGPDKVLSHQDSRYVANEMAQALQEISRGEQTASRLEANLTSLESKLDAMLAAIEASVADGAPGEQEANGPKQEPKS